MAPKTRSATSSPVKKASAIAAHPAQVHEPRKILLLPTDLSSDARLVFLPHPRDGMKKCFLFCSSKGLYEFTRVAAPPTEFQSILIADESPENEPTTVESYSTESAGGYINKDAHMLVATPFDILFLLLPLLPSSLRSSGKVLFQPLDDLLESHVAEDRHLRHIIQDGRSLIEQRFESFCDTVDAGDEKMFRVSEGKALGLIIQKIKQVVQNGLPASLEERFVTRSLEKPVISVKREESSVSTMLLPATPEDDETKSESLDSQSTAVSSTPSMVSSETSMASSVTIVETDVVPADIMQLQRMKVVMDFILASYTSPELSQTIKTRIMASRLLVDFDPLERRMEYLAKLRAEAAASRSLGDFSRKRGNADDDEAAEARAEKKRRLEEDEKKRKASESRGVRDLKKVNVTGMKKMSDFFNKKPAIAKAKS